MVTRRSGLAERPVLLWVDLTGSEHDSMLPRDAEEHCSIHRIRDSQRIAAMVDLVAPNVLCFDYDHPTEAGLAALTRTKRNFPYIPVLMLTKFHSEALAVWALRARVWDYIVKPFSARDILRSAISLFKASREQHTTPKCREIILPRHDAAYTRRLKRGEQIILKAQSYIMESLGDNICLREVAKHCHVSPSHLSRVFRDVSGATFKEFVLQTRVRRAVEMFADGDIAVANVSHEVGFRDISHFGRVFRRFVGMSPSQYRTMLFKNRCATPGHVLPLPAVDSADQIV